MLSDLTQNLAREGISVQNKGQCAACDQNILGEVVHALGKKYHPEHFFCSVCQKEIGNETFVERNEKVYCENCYTTYFTPLCPKCNQPVLDFCTEAMGKKYHPDCFVCIECEKPLKDELFMERNNQIYCEKCYNHLFAPICKKCNKHITSKFIHALGNYYHNDCFSCSNSNCSIIFKNGKFFEFENQPYCEEHYYLVKGSICYACNHILKGSNFIEALDRKYHIEHFICAYCMKQLNVGSFREKQGKLYHHDCFRFLFQR